MKKVIAFLLSFMMLVSLTACSSDNDNTSASSTDGLSSSTQESRAQDSSTKEEATEDAIAAESEEDESDVLKYDVVVAGGGISGMLAALSANQEGAKVLLIEKQGILGGSANLSSGFMVTVDNENFGDEIDDSLETTMDYLMGIHNQSENTDYPDQQYLSDIFAQTGTTIDFMLNLGMKAEFVKKSTAVTAWEGGGYGMVEALTDIIEKKGIDVILNCAAEEILIENGEAVGLKANNDGEELTINAGKVIIATGGASRDTDLMEAYMPTLANVTMIQLSAAGNTGDGFAMMNEVGAQLYDTMLVMGGGLDIDSSFKSAIETRPTTANKMAIDDKGERFVNESPAVNQMITYEMVKNGSSAYYWIYDTSDEELNVSLETGVKLGEVFYADTIAELAEKIGVEADVLQATLTRYQEICAAGVDEDFGKSEENLIAYSEEGGYYAVKYYPVSWGTLGGVVTDEQGHVYDTNNELIPNLFAVGEMSNRQFYGDFYIGGNSLALYSTMGRIAGAAAAEEMK